MSIAEHSEANRQGQLEKWALAEHLANDDHAVKFEEMKILSSMMHYPMWLHQEVIEIYKLNNSLNRKEDCLRLNKAWYPALRSSRIATTDTTSNSVVDTGEQRNWPSSTSATS